ncbi:glycosyltransferase family 2 protein [Fervidobacterium pennivorans]|jgi:glycosyltransferase involved in cell wall biosynthesis|uniref:glycosyltransferase family 2 protein n=1 Tax=Fervidobacterium pennivorans TaxID=93466 RepID=UPI0014369CDA|nr:glycosyltransferase family 2 protein [Fervidobacterium pennivorans]QIV78977.1 glycosyltransferase family 2 protein [Fervidobacterium pennivorans subsp. keratinolyticus]
MSLEKPLVSVVIPAYNVETFIPKTLESVLKQTYENLEIIVVNDGSVDKTGDTVENILANQNRFPYKVIHKRNEGVSVARNIGIENAKGKYIKFLDGDDWLLPDAVEVLVEACEKNNCEIAFGGQDVATPNGKVLYRYDETYVYEEGLKDVRKVNKDFLKGITYISLNSSIFLKNVIDTNQLRFTKGALFAEDNEFISKFLHFSRHAYILNRCIAVLVFRQNSTTKKATLASFHNVASMKRLRRFFERHNEQELVKILDEFVIPSAYAWTIGNLAFNGYPFLEWVRIGRNKNIRNQILKAKCEQNPTKMGKQLSFVKVAYSLFPELSYVLLRLAGIVFRFKSKNK